MLLIQLLIDLLVLWLGTDGSSVYSKPGDYRSRLGKKDDRGSTDRVIVWSDGTESRVPLNRERNNGPV